MSRYLQHLVAHVQVVVHNLRHDVLSELAFEAHQETRIEHHRRPQNLRSLVLFERRDRGRNQAGRRHDQVSRILIRLVRLGDLA